MERESTDICIITQRTPTKTLRTHEQKIAHALFNPFYHPYLLSVSVSEDWDSSIRQTTFFLVSLRTSSSATLLHYTASEFLSSIVRNSLSTAATTPHPPSASGSQPVSLLFQPIASQCSSLFSTRRSNHQLFQDVPQPPQNSDFSPISQTATFRLGRPPDSQKIMVKSSTLILRMSQVLSSILYVIKVTEFFRRLTPAVTTIFCHAAEAKIGFSPSSRTADSV